MPKYHLGVSAKRALRKIAENSERAFGELAADRYVAQLEQAMEDVAEDPFRRGSLSLEQIDARARFYHMKHSGSRVPDPPGRVKEPRHIVVYEQRPDGDVNILGFLYDGIPIDDGLRRVLGEA